MTTTTMNEDGLFDLSEDGIPTKQADGAPVASAPEPPNLDPDQLRQAMEGDGLRFKQAGAGRTSSGPTATTMRSSADPIPAALRELERRARVREATYGGGPASPDTPKVYYPDNATIAEAEALCARVTPDSDDADEAQRLKRDLVQRKPLSTTEQGELQRLLMAYDVPIQEADVSDVDEAHAGRIVSASS